jgi:hypothetical protein
MAKLDDPPTVPVPPVDGVTTAYSQDTLQALLRTEPPPTLYEPKTTVWTQGLSTAPAAEAPTLLLARPTPATPVARWSKRGLVTACCLVATLVGAAVWFTWAHAAQTDRAPRPAPPVSTTTQAAPPMPTAAHLPQAIVPPATTPFPATPHEAARALLSGERHRALQLYLALAARQPETAVYEVAARVLARHALCTTDGATPCEP